MDTVWPQKILKLGTSFRRQGKNTNSYIIDAFDYRVYKAKVQTQKVRDRHNYSYVTETNIYSIEADSLRIETIVRLETHKEKNSLFGYRRTYTSFRCSLL